jgi:predicted RecA/RadA family phage recombinase
MQNEIQPGNRITWTNGTGSAVAAGAVVVLGALICIACVDIANGATGELATEGVFELPKVADTSGHAIAQGEAVVFDVSTGKIDLGAAVAASGDIVGGGIAWEAVLTAATTVKVKINAGHGSVSAG